METFLRIKSLYKEAFANLKTYQAVLLKIASLFILAVLILSFIGILYRIFTGFFVM